jgi:hypothetical protein
MNAKRNKFKIDTAAVVAVSKRPVGYQKAMTMARKGKTTTDLLLQREPMNQPIRISQGSTGVGRLDLGSLQRKVNIDSLAGCIAASERAVSRWSTE